VVPFAGTLSHGRFHDASVRIWRPSYKFSITLSSLSRALHFTDLKVFRCT